MFIRNYIITGEILCKTGLHIGGSNEKIGIGDSDNPIMRDSITNLPFIPGSSLKGKLRSLLELSDKEASQDIINSGGQPSKIGIAAQYFGTSNNEKNETFSNKVIVRDSYPTEETIKLWEDELEILDGAELKYENTINRITSEAKPRNIERVPRDSAFNFEIILTISNENSKNAYDELKPLFKPMKLLQDDYLGGSGTRGFGKIEFTNIKIIERNLKYYTENAKEIEVASGKTINEAINNMK